MATVVDGIGKQFEANLDRVRNLVNLYSASFGKGQGRRPGPDADILRAAVVLLHATLEDLLRSLAEWKIPTASRSGNPCEGLTGMLQEPRTMTIQAKVKKVLEQLPLSGLSVEIEPNNGFRVVAVVTSTQFEKMDEGDRQHLVWKQLIEKLNPDEQTLVEFVHTIALSEREPVHDGR